MEPLLYMGHWDIPYQQGEDQHLSSQNKRKCDPIPAGLSLLIYTMTMTTAVKNVRSSETEVSWLILVFISMVAMVISIKIWQ